MILLRSRDTVIQNDSSDSGFCRIPYLSKLFCCATSLQSINFLEMSATDFICAALIETKMCLFRASQKSGSLILKLIIYPAERGEITEIPNVAARPRGLPLLMTSPAVTSVGLFVEEDGNQHDCALAGKKISYETSRKEFLRITLSNWILISSSAVEVVSPDLICFFAAVGAKSKLHQVPLSWRHSRHLCSWFLQNKASQTETIIQIKKNTAGKRRILLFLIVTVSSSAIWDEDLPNVRRRQKMRRRLRQ